jgi:hypothetical protein
VQEKFPLPWSRPRVKCGGLMRSAFLQPAKKGPYAIKRAAGQILVLRLETVPRGGM